MVHLAAVVHESGKAGGMGGLYDEVNVALVRQAALKAKTEGVPHFALPELVLGLRGRGGGRGGGRPRRGAAPLDPLRQEQARRRAGPRAAGGAGLRGRRAAGAPRVRPWLLEGQFPRLAKLARVSPVFPDVDNARSMLYSRSLAELVRLLVEEGRGGLFLPQDAERVRTSEMVRLLAEAQGRSIRLSRALGAAVGPLARVNPTFGKLFGGARYSLEASECGLDYRVATLEEAVRESVGREAVR